MAKTLEDMDFVSQSPFVPGYTGHVAGMRHTLGETFGRVTTELASDPIVVSKTTRKQDMVMVSGLSSHKVGLDCQGWVDF